MGGIDWGGAAPWLQAKYFTGGQAQGAQMQGQAALLHGQAALGQIGVGYAEAAAHQSAAEAQHKQAAAAASQAAANMEHAKAAQIGAGAEVTRAGAAQTAAEAQATEASARASTLYPATAAEARARGEYLRANVPLLGAQAEQTGAATQALRNELWADPNLAYSAANAYVGKLASSPAVAAAVNGVYPEGHPAFSPQGHASGTKSVKGGKSTDTVPAMLTPGEAVINKPAMDMIERGHPMGRGIIDAINTAGLHGGGMPATSHDKQSSSRQGYAAGAGDVRDWGAVARRARPDYDPFTADFDRANGIPTNEGSAAAHNYWMQTTPVMISPRPGYRPLPPPRGPKLRTIQDEQVPVTRDGYVDERAYFAQQQAETDKLRNSAQYMGRFFDPNDRSTWSNSYERAYNDYYGNMTKDWARAQPWGRDLYPERAGQPTATGVPAHVGTTHNVDVLDAWTGARSRINFASPGYDTVAIGAPGGAPASAVTNASVPAGGPYPDFRLPSPAHTPPLAFATSDGAPVATPLGEVRDREQSAAVSPVGPIKMSTFLPGGEHINDFWRGSYGQRESGVRGTGQELMTPQPIGLGPGNGMLTRGGVNNPASISMPNPRSYVSDYQAPAGAAPTLAAPAGPYVAGGSLDYRGAPQEVRNPWGVLPNPNQGISQTSDVQQLEQLKKSSMPPSSLGLALGASSIPDIGTQQPIQNYASGVSYAGRSIPTPTPIFAAPVPTTPAPLFTSPGALTTPAPLFTSPGALTTPAPWLAPSGSTPVPVRHYALGAPAVKPASLHLNKIGSAVRLAEGTPNVPPPAPHGSFGDLMRALTPPGGPPSSNIWQQVDENIRQKKAAAQPAAPARSQGLALGTSRLERDATALVKAAGSKGYAKGSKKVSKAPTISPSVMAQLLQKAPVADNAMPMGPSDGGLMSALSGGRGMV